MLFHSWQNTLVMTIPADTGNPWFMPAFLLLGAASALLCLVLCRPDSTDSILLGESPVPENTGAVSENTCTVQEDTDTAPKTAATAPQKEEKLPVRDKFPANSLLLVVLGTIIVLVLYLVTNMW